MSSDVGPVLRILYRHYGGDNTKPRPAYYSKMLALTSLLRAAQALPRQPEIVYINDQVRPGPILSLMESTGEVMPVRGGSDSRSYRAMLTREAGRQGPADQLLWFSEDDYLHRPDALAHLAEGAARLPQADYLTMFGSGALDTEASTRRVTNRPEPGAAGDPAAVEIDGVHWYRAVSCTSTFGTRLGTLREDLRILRLCAVSGGSWDHTTALTLGGFRTFRAGRLAKELLPFGSARPAEWPRSVARGAVRLAVTARSLRRPSHRRTLYATDPELISHMESDLPGARPAPSARTAATDWASIARDTAAWAEDRGISLGEAVAP